MPDSKLNDIDRVDWFAEQMKDVLHRNVATKRGWNQAGDLHLMAKLMEEVGEVARLLWLINRRPPEERADAGRWLSRSIRAGATDIGNLAFMLADNADRRLHEENENGKTKEK